MLVAAATLTLAAVALGGGAGEAESWRSAFERRGQFDLRGRVIVVLASPSLADRVAAGEGLPSAKVQRQLARETDVLQRRLVAALRRQGVAIRRDRVYTLVLNGFSTVVDARALAALERTPGVAGVYPVRAVYPAALTARAAAFRATSPPLALPGSTGAGVTVALLDSGVDRQHPSLTGRVLFGVDLLGRDASAEPGKRPGSGELETHGTRMAALVVGRSGQGTAPDARILPIRILGWRRTVDGSYEEAGTGDALLAGLERAVDPDGDGDVEDAVRIALAPIVEPYASFPDSPESRAVEGAARLGTLVVAAVGNDGPGGEGGAGTVGAPASADAALAVGAADLRPAVERVRITVASAGATLFSGAVRLLGGLAPDGSLQVPVVALRGPTLSDPGRPAAVLAPGLARGDLLDVEGRSLVAGKALVVPADGRPLRSRVANAARAGARAVVVYGTTLPGGSLGLEERAAITTVALPARAGASIERALAGEGAVRITIEPTAPPERNAGAEQVAPFSSGGVSSGGRPKPDVVAPGVALLTADPRGAADGAPRYAIVSGTSVAAAVAAGAAALVASQRPELDAAALRAVLVGGARQLTGLPTQPITRAGAGMLDPVAADAAEVVAEPATLAAGRWTTAGWSAVVPVRVRNVSIRSLRVSLGLVVDGDEATLTLTARPAALDLAPGEEATIQLLVQSRDRALVRSTLSGVVVLSPEGGPPARVPWAAVVAPAAGALVGDAALTSASIVPSRKGTPPASILTFRAGGVTVTSGGTVVEPVGRLDVEIWRDGVRLGAVARLRDLLPGRYAVAITGRGPDGRRLSPGRYQLVLRAEGAAPSEGGAGRSAVAVSFEIERRGR